MTDALTRSFEVTAVEVEGRTVDVRVVPFGEVARVADPPDWEPYDEEFVPGCFDHQLSAANRVHANYEHGKGISDVVGHGVSLRQERDGYHLTSTIHRTNNGDTALELINAGALPGVSVEFHPVRNVKAGSVIQRVKANLRGFAFCRQGAFPGAQVLAVRSEDDEPEQTLDAALLPVDIDPERVERLRAQGIVLPDRYQAHPAEDTPDTSGTSDDGTRHVRRSLRHHVIEGEGMTPNESQAERTLQLRVDAREQTHGKQDALLREIGSDTPTPEQNEMLAKYRSDLVYFDGEIDNWSDQVDADRKARQKSDEIRRAQNSARGITDFSEEGQVVYRTMSSYARDILLTHGDRYARAAVENSGVPAEEVQRATERLQSLERTPATTLTSDIAGLSPPQHIAQIFQVINSRRDLVEAAGTRATLNKLTVTYPQVDATPVVAVQGTQKTEAGNTGMDISMVTKTASTYLGGGNLSWQAIEFSDPNALDLWFRYAAADYALKTETDAATVVSASAYLNNIASTITGTPTFAQLMTAIAAGGGDVYANSGRMANAVIMAPDRYWFALGLTSDASLSFGNNGSLAVDPEGRRLRVIVSRGLNAGEIIVGDLDGLLVAENAGAPVRMFVSEPAIAGVEVGLVGAFEAAVVDDGAFALITTAS